MASNEKSWANRKRLLTKAELHHLTNHAGCKTKAQFQNTINKQQKMRTADRNPRVEPCWDCRFIAKKMHMSPEIN